MLAGTIVGLLVSWIGLDEVLARCAELPPQVVLAGLAGALSLQWLASLRLRVLARSQGLPLSGLESLSINLAAVFYGLFLPGGSATGWLVRLLRMSSDPTRLGGALVALASDRLFATGVGAAIGLVADLLLRSPATPAASMVLAGIALGTGLAGLAAYTPTAAAALRRSTRLPVVGRIAARLVRGGQTVRRPGLGTIVSATVLSIATHGVGIAIWLLIAGALGMEVDVLTIAWVRSLAQAAALVPITISGLGVREGVAVYLMALFGHPAADSLALSLLVFTITVLAIGILGGLVEAARLVASGRRAQS